MATIIGSFMEYSIVQFNTALSYLYPLQLNQHAVPWPLLLASGDGMMYGRPQYGQNFYAGLLYDNGFQNRGWDDLDVRNNGISGFNFDLRSVQHGAQAFPQVLRVGNVPLGTRRAPGGATHYALPTYDQSVNVMSTYFDNVHAPFMGQGQVKLRRKRNAEYTEEEPRRRRGRKGRRRHRRPRPTDQLDTPGPSGQPGMVLGKAHRCPKIAGGPLRFTLKVPPS